MSPTSNLSFEELQSEPDRTAVREVIASVAGRGFEVVDVARMEGGIENGCHRLTAESADGKRLRFVLRRYSWRPNVPSPAARCSREWALLQALRRAGGPVPRPRWFDDSGKVFRAPALVYDFVPGRALQPAEGAGGWTRGAAEALHEVHRIGLSLPGPEVIRPDRELEEIFRSDSAPRRFRGYPLAQRLFTATKAAAREVVEVPRTVIHTDYWAGNTVWSDGRLQAIIDWDYGCLGDPAFDVAYMWMDLSIVGRRPLGEQFILDYEEISGVETTNLKAYQLLALSRPLPDLGRWFPFWDEEKVARAESRLKELIIELTAG